MWMRIVILQREILVDKGEKILHVWIDFQCRQRSEFTGELQLRLLNVIRIQMHIASGPYKLSGLQVTHLRYHEREQRIACNVEWNAQKGIATALV